MTSVVGAAAMVDMYRCAEYGVAEAVNDASQSNEQESPESPESMPS